MTDRFFVFPSKSAGTSLDDRKTVSLSSKGKTVFFIGKSWRLDGLRQRYYRCNPEAVVHQGQHDEVRAESNFVEVRRQLCRSSFAESNFADILCQVTGHFVQLFGSLEMSNCEIFVELVSEKWLFLCVEAAIPPL